MNKKKLLMLTLVGAIAFTLGYGVVGKAFPSPYYYGYFYNRHDDPGREVLPPWGGPASLCYANGLAIPMWVDTADDFIYWIDCKLKYADEQSHIGAAFIISTMTGISSPNPDATHFNDFAARVRYAESLGRINWHAPPACVVPNTYYQDDVIDVAAYGGCGVSSESITFSRDGGASIYNIKRYCANPVGDMSPLPAVWSATGATTVTDGSADPGDTQTNITTRPGERLTFNNAITNNGPGPAGIWYALFGHADATSFTGEYFNNRTLSGPPVLTRSDPGQLAFNWGVNSPGPGIGADNWSARWSKTEYFAAGTYTFETVVDDGVRVYVDGALIIDRWIDQGPTRYSANVALTEGNHSVTVEYFEGAVTAVTYFIYYMNVQGGVNAGGFSPGQTKNFIHTVDVPPGATPGSKICRRILWDWKNSSGVGDFSPYWTWGMAGAACATVSGNYNLNPSVTTPGSGFAQEGETVRFNYFVQNVGSESGSAQCFVRNQSGGAVTVPGLTCSASQSFPSNPGGPPLPVGSEDFIIPSGTPAGTSICRTLHVQPASATVATRASEQRCVIVVKTPYVHFMGGDVWAGGGFKQADGTCPVTSNKITTLSRSLGGPNGDAGSMVEYAAFAQGPITQFGTASKALLAGAPIGNLARALAFANNSGTPGNFAAPTRCIDDFAAQYASVTQACPGVINVSAPPPNPCRAAGNVTIPAGALPGGSRQIYIVNGDVNITGSLTYPGSYTGQSNIPSLVIIANGNIRVNGSVRQLDGIYVTRGTFFTCQEKPALPTATCNQDLTVNGAVVAKTLDLYRTAGAEGATPAARKAPAEIFNLRPEVYLRNGLNDTTKTTITTSESRELPPRF